MADSNEIESVLKNSPKLRAEGAAPTEEIIHAPENLPEQQELRQPSVVSPTQEITKVQTNRVNSKTILLVAAGVGLAGFALVDLSTHNFSAATANYWMSAFAVIGAVISLRRAVKRAFKKSADGTIYLIGEDPGKAARPSSRTYLIMLIIFLIFVAVIVYAGYNSVVSGHISL